MLCFAFPAECHRDLRFIWSIMIVKKTHDLFRENVATKEGINIKLKLIVAAYIERSIRSWIIDNYAISLRTLGD